MAGWLIPKNVYGLVVNIMTWKKWEWTPTIIPCLKCWVTGVLVIILNMKLLVGVGNYSLLFIKFRKTDYMPPFLKAMKKKGCLHPKLHLKNGNSFYQMSRLFLEIRKIISGKWATLVPVAPVVKYMLIVAVMKKEKKHPAICLSIKIIHR